MLVHAQGELSTFFVFKSTDQAYTRFITFSFIYVCFIRYVFTFFIFFIDFFTFKFALYFYNQ